MTTATFFPDGVAVADTAATLEWFRAELAASEPSEPWAGCRDDIAYLERILAQPAAQRLEPIDWREFEQFLHAIGRDRGPLVVALFPPDPSKPCIHFACDAEAIPRQRIEQKQRQQPELALGLVLNHPLAQPADWGSKPEHINKGGKVKAWGATKTHISHAIGIWAECDGGLPLEAQGALPALAGLHEPSLANWSGSKSLHLYWLLEPSEVLDPDTFEALQQRLTGRLTEVAPDAKPDTSIKNANRLMRAPGGIHPKTGQPCRIHISTDKRFTVAELLEMLPAPEPAPQQPRPATWQAAPDRPRTYEELERLVSGCPPIPAKSGLRLEALAFVAGLTRCMEQIGKGSADAIALASHYHPQAADTFRQVEDWPFGQLDTGSFVNQCKKAGVDVTRHDLRRATPDLLEGFEVQDGEKGAGAPRSPSFQSLIQRLPDGWNRETQKPAQLSPGQLADMLPAAALRFNEMTLRAEVHTASGWRVITDADLDSAYVVLTGKGWKVGSEPVIKAIIHTARQAPHHPVRAYLQQVEADTTIIPFDLNQVAPRFFRASAPLHVAMVRAWLTGAVSRALSPGCQMDYCLVLKGGQGPRKSRSLEALASVDWYSSSIPENEKDLLLNVHSTWIYELAELESVTSRKESGRLKNLITTSVDLVRVPYGRTSERMPRPSVFCATVNEDTFLRDDTGNRRYWVVPVEGSAQLDKEGLLAARDGIWKSAVAAYRAGELPMLAPEMERLSAQQNEEFNAQDPWTEMVRAWMDGDPLHRWDPDRDPSTMRYDTETPFTSADVLYSAGLRRPDAITRADEMRVAAVLRQLGFNKGRQQRIDGRVARLWELSQPSQPQAAEVVTPQRPCAAVDLGQLSQPSQPNSLKKEEESRRKEGGQPATASGFEGSFEKCTRGCDTPSPRHPLDRDRVG